MKLLLIAGATVVAVGVALVVGHLAFIELGREVVTLRTPLPEGGWQETRLWIVDDGAESWLHSAGEKWAARFEGDPVVEVERHGTITRFRAHAEPGPHPQVDALLRKKYGLADRWVRFLAPCESDTVPVRLTSAKRECEDEDCSHSRQPPDGALQSALRAFDRMRRGRISASVAVAQR